MTTTMIGLEQITKRYPGQEKAAVTELTMDIAAGEIVVFVGTSGCGKTTTMKLLIRPIEPTSGRIIPQGEDVTTVTGSNGCPPWSGRIPPSSPTGAPSNSPAANSSGSGWPARWAPTRR